jgi:Tetratricopeptide repeat
MAGDDGRAQVQLDEDTLARRRRDLGEDHPDTLSSADGLAISLRAVGGYPGTLTPPATSPPAFVTPASTRRPGSSTKTPWPAAAALFELGEYQAARELNEDILARRRRVLGEDHRDTGASATFAIFLRTPRPLLKTLGWVSRRRRAG